jgi:hypothetical protein
VPLLAGAGVPRFIEVLSIQRRSENENYVIPAENFSDTSNKKFALIKPKKIVDVRTKNCNAPNRDYEVRTWTQKTHPSATTAAETFRRAW